MLPKVCEGDEQFDAFLYASGSSGVSCALSSQLHAIRLCPS